jgi:hypothetical protein
MPQSITKLSLSRTLSYCALSVAITSHDKSSGQMRQYRPSSSVKITLPNAFCMMIAQGRTPFQPQLVAISSKMRIGLSYEQHRCWFARLTHRYQKNAVRDTVLSARCDAESKGCGLSATSSESGARADGSSPRLAPQNYSRSTPSCGPGSVVPKATALCVCAMPNPAADAPLPPAQASRSCPLRGVSQLRL